MTTKFNLTDFKPLKKGYEVVISRKEMEKLNELFKDESVQAIIQPLRKAITKCSFCGKKTTEDKLTSITDSETLRQIKVCDTCDGVN